MSPFPQPPGAARGMPVAGAGGPLAALRNHPRFAQLRMVVQQSPQMMNQVLSAIAQSDPSLVTLIAEHQEEFVQMLQETSGLPPMVVPPQQGGQLPAQLPGGQAAPPAGGALQPPMDPVAAMLAAAQAAQAGQAGAGAAPAAPGAAPAAGAAAPAAPAASPQVPSVALTPAEQEAVGRLQALGFERMVAVEAFLACDRNEELAANYLFESMD
uniref:UBA domain-containing protein n=1 Tax=Alexandrium andersonii TaxID=327968 RepID=A0A7S2DTS8_9DINO